MLNRRHILLAGISAAALAAMARLAIAGPSEKTAATTFEVTKSEEEWKKLLTSEQYYVLRKHGTERAGTSPLDKQYGPGTYACAGCDLPLFTSDMKFESGTGWPSFFTTIPGVFETKKDFHLIYPREEYHCTRCGGHHGHLFEDGPKPTGLRYCNNGVALKFIPKSAKA
ncbi:MAG: peptide-methionine (R)-S-oxide reductase MsrB [Alphaproteobacteria bacterium]|nr:MAG: peptide-methionine (R)-S-oxide reductase MsrB [Alphaproteobacteria bacterium]